MLKMQKRLKKILKIYPINDTNAIQVLDQESIKTIAVKKKKEMYYLENNEC